MSNKEGTNIEQRGEQKESREQLPIFSIALAMESAQDSGQRRELLNAFLSAFPEEVGVSLSEDVSSIYQAMSEESLLVRRQSVSATVKSITEAQVLDLGESEKKYANSVVPNNEGIKIALAEGETQGPIISLIGFDPKNIRVSSIEVSKNDPRDTALRSALCRHVDGVLSPEDIKYLVLRMPRSLVDEKYLTESEKQSGVPFIFRGADLTNKEGEAKSQASIAV